MMQLTSSLKEKVLGWGRGDVAQTMYMHVSKCKNDKIKGEKNPDCFSFRGLAPRDICIKVILLLYTCTPQ
jgi:hypothetical protein